MKFFRFSWTIGLTLAISLCVFYASRAATSTRQENYCFTCHTSARKLIKITREISKVNKGKPGASAKTEGEG